MPNKELETQIQNANTAYASGIPFMTDEDYDILWQRLHSIDPTNPLLYHTAQNRTNLTGKTWHKYPIFGTNKAFNMTDLKPFLMRFGSQKLVIEPKYDGCAAVITQTNTGIAITLEGDGHCGGDITHLMPFIKMPFNLRHFQAVEIIIPFKDWNPDYGKNPRNVVSGWLARKYDKPETSMTAIPHNFGQLSQEYDYDGDIDFLGEFLLRLHAEWSQIYPIDGLMIKVADEKQRLIAGNNGQSNNWSIAWKPPIQVKQTVVTDIEWNVSRLGRLIPTVIYKPIDLCGTINSRVTANNAKWLRNKEIAIGSSITVGKAGEIIPKIIKVVNTIEMSNGSTIKLIGANDNEFIQGFTGSAIYMDLPTHCPKCGEMLEWSSVHLTCPGENCIAKKIISIAYFYSHKGIKIDGIGEAMIEKLLQNSNCYNVLTFKPWALLDMYAYNILHNVAEILGSTITNNIIGEVNNVNKTKSMAHFISGLGLPGLAYKTSLRLCQYLKTGKINIHISDNARQSFIMAATVYKTAIDELQNFKFTNLPNTAKAVYCITGALSQSREDMIAYLETYDYEFSSSVTRETNYLIVGESPGKTKIAKAIKHNIPQITEAQLIILLKELSK